MNIGDKVKDVYGEIHTVARVEGTTLYMQDGCKVHVTKCWRVK